jgi:hypothetical protein
MPGLTAKTGPVIPGMGRNERLSIQYVQEEGGEVISATVGRRTIALQSSSTLIGTVFDSTRRAPLAGAVVHLAGTSHQTRTDSAGSFRLSGLPEGTYTLRVEHPRLDSLGTAARELATSLARGEERRVSLFIPSVATIMAVHCPRSRLLDSAAVLRGVVRSKEGAPLAGVSLALSWNASAASTSRTLEDRRVVAESESGRDGAYVLCGPPDQLLELRLTRGASTVLLPIRLTAGTITAKDVELEASTGH